MLEHERSISILSKPGLAISITLFIIAILYPLLIEVPVFMSIPIYGGALSLFIRSFRSLKIGQGITVSLGGALGAYVIMALYLGTNIKTAMAILYVSVVLLLLGFKNFKKASQTLPSFRKHSSNFDSNKSVTNYKKEEAKNTKDNTNKKISDSHEENKSSWFKYFDRDRFLSISYPKNWKMKILPDGVLHIIPNFAKEVIEDGESISDPAIKLAAGTAKNAQGWFNDYEPYLKNELKYTILSTSNVLINGYPAKIIHYEFKKGYRTIEALTLQQILGEKIWMYEAGGTRDQMRANHELINSALVSLKILSTSEEVDSYQSECVDFQKQRNETFELN